MHLARKTSLRSLRHRTRARGAIVRADRSPFCAELIGKCRPKRHRMQRSCTWLGTLSEDPIGFGDGPNVYVYVGSDPVNFRDPTGQTAAGNPLFDLSSNSNFDTGFSNFNDLIFGGPVSTPALSSFDTSSNFTGLSFPPDQGFSNFLDQRDRQNSLAFPNALVNADLSGIAQSRLLQNQNPVTEATQIADVASSVTPIVSDFRDFTEFATGRDVFEPGKKLSITQRVLTGVAAVLPLVSGKLLRQLFTAVPSGPIATTATGKNFIQTNHLQAAAGETQLIQALQRQPNTVILSTNRTVTDNGADVITFNTQSGQVTFFDNKATIGGKPRKDGTRPPLKINPSKTFKKGPRLDKVLIDAEAAIRNSNLSAADQLRALNSLDNNTFRKVTRGSGNAQGPTIQTGR